MPLEVFDRLNEAADGRTPDALSAGHYLAGGTESEVLVDAALDGVREECAKLIGAGKKVIVQ